MKLQQKNVFICKQCHEIDKKIIGCNKSFEEHKSMFKSNCDICGKITDIVYCSKYTKK